MFLTLKSFCKSSLELEIVNNSIKSISKLKAKDFTKTKSLSFNNFYDKINYHYNKINLLCNKCFPYLFYSKLLDSILETFMCITKNSIHLSNKKKDNIVIFASKVDFNLKELLNLKKNTSTLTLFVEQLSENNYPNIIFNKLQNFSLEDLIKKIKVISPSEIFIFNDVNSINPFLIIQQLNLNNTLIINFNKPKLILGLDKYINVIKIENKENKKNQSILKNQIIEISNLTSLLDNIDDNAGKKYTIKSLLKKCLKLFYYLVIILLAFVPILNKIIVKKRNKILAKLKDI